MGFKVQYSEDDLQRAVLQIFKPKFDPDETHDVWDLLDRVFKLCPNRLPANPAQAVLFAERVLVLPTVYNPGSRNVLAEALLCSPNRLFLVRDPALDSAKGLYMVMSGVDADDIAAWVANCIPLRIALGEHKGLRIIAAPMMNFNERQA